jgi:hypothetical protein
MRTPIKLSWLIMSLALALSACNDSVEMIPLLSDLPIIVNANVEHHTKAGYGADILPEKFYMDIIQGDVDKYNFTLIEMTQSSDDENRYYAPDDINLLWKDNTYSASIKAMTVPYGLTHVDSEKVMTFSVSKAQDVEANIIASDLLGADNSSTGGIIVEEGDVSIKFKHLLSKFDIKYEFGDEFLKNTVSVNSIVLENICTTGGYSYANMAYSTTSLDYGNIVMYHDSSKKQAEAIFYPYIPDEPIRLIINASIDGKPQDFSCPIVAKNDKGFVGGKRYTMTVSIRGTSVSSTAASIAAGWDNNTTEQSFVTK